METVASALLRRLRKLSLKLTKFDIIARKS